MAKEDYKSGSVEVEGRTFEIEFWTERTSISLPYFRVSEIIIEKKKPWYSNKIRTYKRKIEICDGWSADNRLEVAMQRIARYLQREKDEAEELKQIEEFCNMNG